MVPLCLLGVECAGNPCPSNLHGGTGMAAVQAHLRLLLVGGPLAVRRGRGCPVLGLGSREGEVLAGVGLRGDGVGLRPRGRRLLLGTVRKTDR